jgi:hypothetical protein
MLHAFEAIGADVRSNWTDRGIRAALLTVAAGLRDEPL